MKVEHGYSEHEPYLVELTNDSDISAYVVFIVMGGSGFRIDEISSGGTWREGVGEEYCGYFDSREAADDWIREYIERQAVSVIAEDVLLNQKEKQTLIDALPDIVRETPKSSEAAKVFQELLKKAAKVTAAALLDLLVNIVAEAVKRILWP